MVSQNPSISLFEKNWTQNISQYYLEFHVVGQDWFPMVRSTICGTQEKIMALMVPALKKFGKHKLEVQQSLNLV